MIILGIESSCDDTSVALLEANSDGFRVLAEKTRSQIDIHKQYGGVVPEIAGRYHAEAIVPLIEEVLNAQPKPDIIAVTSGPGLITGLIVGVEAAKTLSYLTDIPLIGVNHISGHIHSVEIKNEKSKMKNEIQFPALALVVSGGHTELIVMKDHNTFEKIGRTRDDAAGECFDKVAKLVGLEYPGGPKISKLAADGNTNAITFPRPMLDSDNYDFSFAGLKTSALYWLRDNRIDESGIRNQESATAVGGIPKISLNDFCASFEQAIIDVLVTKTLRAAKEYHPKSILLVGGVAANKKLRETLQHEVNQHIPDSQFLIPDSAYCMDNGAMIAVAGYYRAITKEFSSWKELQADPNWELGDAVES